MGDGTFVIEFGYICYQDTYPMYLTCIVHEFSMYLDVSRHIHQDTFQIHQDTFVSLTLANIRKCILPRDICITTPYGALPYGLFIPNAKTHASRKGKLMLRES